MEEAAKGRRRHLPAGFIAHVSLGLLELVEPSHLHLVSVEVPPPESSGGGNR